MIPLLKSWAPGANYRQLFMSISLSFCEQKANKLDVSFTQHVRIREKADTILDFKKMCMFKIVSDVKIPISVRSRLENYKKKT